MIIDIHNHPDWYGYNIDRFLANMRQYGIDKTCILSWESPADEFDPYYNKNIMTDCINGPIPFSRCAAYIERAPEKFIPGYAPDPRKPGAIDSLNAAIGLYGVKIYGELKLRMMYDNPDALRMYRFCGEKGLPVLVHIDYEFDSGATYPRPNYWYGGGIDAFERAVKACPGTYFIGHAPGFWAHISGDDLYDKVPYPSGIVVPGGRVEEMMRRYKNLYCDISGGSGHNALKRDLGYTRDFLLEFQDRILYGRDFFDNNHQELLNSLELPAEVLDKIYSGNTIKLLKLA